MRRQGPTPDGAERIRRERVRQRSSKEYDPAHDLQHARGELALAAACYAAPLPIFTAAGADPFPWDPRYDRRGSQDRERELEKAGALICAELDRLAALRREAVEIPTATCAGCAGSGRRFASASSRETLAKLAELGPLTAAQLAREVGLDPKTTAASMRLDRLRRAGLCWRRLVGGVWVYSTDQAAPVTKQEAEALGHAFHLGQCYRCSTSLSHISRGSRCPEPIIPAAPKPRAPDLGQQGNKQP